MTRVQRDQWGKRKGQHLVWLLAAPAGVHGYGSLLMLGFDPPAVHKILFVPDHAESRPWLPSAPRTAATRPSTVFGRPTHPVRRGADRDRWRLSFPSGSGISVGSPVAGSRGGHATRPDGSIRGASPLPPVQVVARSAREPQGLLGRLERGQILRRGGVVEDLAVLEILGGKLLP